MSLIRVVSYNIHKGRSALGRRDSLNELRLGLYGLRPDLVFLQEVQGRNEQKSLLDATNPLPPLCGWMWPMAATPSATRRTMATRCCRAIPFLTMKTWTSPTIDWSNACLLYTSDAADE